MRRAAVLSAVAAAAVPAGASAAPCAIPGHPQVCGHFGVLHREARAADRLRARAQPTGYVEGSSRRLKANPRLFFAAEGEQRACLIWVMPDNFLGFCGPVRGVAKGHVQQDFGCDARGRRAQALLMTDGVTDATVRRRHGSPVTVPVRHNLLFYRLRGVPKRIVWRQAGRRHSIEAPIVEKCG